MPAPIPLRASGFGASLGIAILLLVSAVALLLPPRHIGAEPGITLSPASGPPGTVVQVSGNGWPAGQPLALLWDGGQRLADGIADSAPACSGRRSSSRLARRPVATLCLPSPRLRAPCPWVPRVARLRPG